MTSQAKLTLPVDALISFHYFRDDADVAELVATDRLALIGDSGAFSALHSGASIDLAQYAAWVSRWRAHLLWAASLDVIGDAAGSLRNWRILRDVHGVATVPTVHAGAPPEALDVYAGEGATLVGLGGLAKGGRNPTRDLVWAIAMFRRARDRWPRLRFHIWGITNRKYLAHLPAWSADSSGTLSRASRFGHAVLVDPSTGIAHRVHLDGREPYRHGQLLRRVYGVDPADVATAEPGNRLTLLQLSAAVTQQYAAWLQRRHHVQPPEGLAGEGTRIHLVSTREDLLKAVGAPVPSRKRGTK